MATICSREKKEGELMQFGEGFKGVSEVTKELCGETKDLLKELDKPLNTSEYNGIMMNKNDSLLKKLERPLNERDEVQDTFKIGFDKLSSDSKLAEKFESKNDSELMKKVGKIDNPQIIEGVGKSDNKQLIKEMGKTDIQHDENREKNSRENSNKDVGEIKRMEPKIIIVFKCPEGMDRKEFIRQLKAQERGLNSQTVAENMDNREQFQQRKNETGNGRDVSEGKKAQDIAREKAIQSRIESNQKNGMSYSEAKAEAQEWIKTQAALHNPDQIAGGDPGKVSRMGDTNVNSSIGAQWKTRVGQLADGVNAFANDKTRDELENTKMNVKLVVV